MIGRAFARRGPVRVGAAPGPDVALVSPEALRGKAIAALARREHSRAELAAKLSRICRDRAAIDAVLEQLEVEGLLSDARFAQGVGRVRGARHGSARVANDLRSKGVSADDAGPIVDQLRSGDMDRARALWDLKVGAPATDAAGRARQMRFLHARGFPADVIRRVVPRAQGGDGDE